MQRGCCNSMRNSKAPKQGLSERQQYALKALPAHLLAAQRLDYLQTILLDFRFVEQKISVHGPQVTLQDYKAAIDALGSQNAIALLRDTLTLCADTLAQDQTQFAGQLLGRIQPDKSEQLAAMLERALQYKRQTWLRPLRPTLLAAGQPLRQTLTGHWGTITSIAVTPDGSRFLSASIDRTVRLWEVATGVAVNVFYGHSSPVIAVRIFPDGKRAISVSFDGAIKVWEIENGVELFTLDGQNQSATCLEISSDGQIVATGSIDGILAVWNLPDISVRFTLHGHSEAISAIAISPGGDYLFSGSRDKTIRVWSLQQKREACVLTTDVEAIRTIHLTCDGRYLFSSLDSLARAKCKLTGWVWTESAKRDEMHGHDFRINAITSTPDGRHVISASADGSIKIWDISTLSEIATFCCNTIEVTSVAITPSGNTLISGAEDNSVRIWHFDEHAIPGSHVARSGAIWAVVTTLDGQWVVANSSHGATILDLTTGDVIRNLALSLNGKSIILPVPDTRYIVTNTFMAEIQVWELASAEVIQNFVLHGDDVSHMTVTPDGRTIYAATSSFTDALCTLTQCSLVDEAEVCLWQSTTELITALASNGQYMVWAATSSNEEEHHSIYVRNAASGEVIWEFHGHQQEISALYITSNGQCCVSVSDEERLIQVWDLHTGELLQGVEGNSPLTPHPSEQKFFYVSNELGSPVCFLSGWDIAAAAQLFRVRAHAQPIDSLAMTPDGSRFVSGAWDHTIAMWDTRTGSMIARFTGDSPCHACAIAPDGKTVVMGEQSGRVHILRLEEMNN